MHISRLESCLARTCKPVIVGRELHKEVLSLAMRTNDGSVLLPEGHKQLGLCRPDPQNHCAALQPEWDGMVDGQNPA